MARYEATMNRSDRAAAKNERERLDQKEADEKQKADDAARAPKEVQVQRGFSDTNPVTLEENSGNGAPVVEKGLPPDAIDDQQQAASQDTAAKSKKR